MEHLTETEDVYSPSVEILIISNVMEKVMKHGTVMNSVVHVRRISTQPYLYYNVYIIEKPYWGPWAHWSSCSKSCGGGVTFRKRQCYHSKCPHPVYKNCIGNDYEESKCNTQCCPGTYLLHTTKHIVNTVLYIHFFFREIKLGSMDRMVYL